MLVSLILSADIILAPADFDIDNYCEYEASLL